jgi:translocator protein
VFKNPVVVLLFLVLLCFGAAFLGSMLTVDSVKNWYTELRKPALTPPGWVFGPVWSILYLLMAISAWLVWRQAGIAGARLALGLFVLQLALNVLWSGIFFGLHRPGMALAEIMVLEAAIIVTAIQFSFFSRPAFWLMVPYIVWVGFATFLNLRIWQLNARPA